MDLTGERSDLSIHEVRAFHEVGSAKSISRASERLGMTQPGLSRIIRKLENQLGVPLLLRVKHGVELTKAGQKFLTESRGLLHYFEELKNAVRGHNEAIEGSYSIGAHPQVAAVTFPRLFRRLLSTSERLELRPVHDISRRIVEGVVSYRIDFGVVVDPVRHPELTLVPLFTDTMGFWKAQGEYDPKVVLGDLNLKQTEKILAEAYQAGLLADVRVIPCSDLLVVREMAAYGVGVGILTASVARHLSDTRLTSLQHWPVCEEKIFLVYRKDAQRSTAAKLIRDAIVGELKDGRR
jgi:DNA-binding transcriptional LysR family regulator